MKECLEKSAYILQNIIERAQDREDMTYLRIQNVELTTKLRIALNNEGKHKREIEALNREVLHLKSNKIVDSANGSMEPRVVLSRVDAGGVGAKVSPGPSSPFFPPLPRRLKESGNLHAASGTNKDKVSAADKTNLDGLSNKEDMIVGRETYVTGLDIDTSIDELIYTSLR